MKKRVRGKRERQGLEDGGKRQERIGTGRRFNKEERGERERLEEEAKRRRKG